MPDPILKWPGSKLARRATLAALFADDARPVFCDPMAGSLSVPLAMPLHERGVVVLGDAGPRLMATYRAVRADPEGVARALATFPPDVGMARATAMCSGMMATENTPKLGRYRDPWKAYYYGTRAKLNAWVPRRGERASNANAALFVWCQRAAFNGLFRTGADGTSSSATVGDGFTLPTLRQLCEFGHHLRGALLVDTDVAVTVGLATFMGAADVFLDPPYAGDYDGYCAGGFPRRAALPGLVRKIISKGGRVIVTEADHPDAWAWLQQAGLHIERIVSRTSISRDAKQRGAKAELLARSWPW